MKVSAEFLNTDNVEVSLTITMPLSSWKALRDDIDPNGHWYPSGKLFQFSLELYQIERLPIAAISKC